MKKLILMVIVLVAVGAGAGAYYLRRPGPEPKVATLQISRGDIVDAVAATGTLEAVTTVQVGTQVSGTVQELYADFNDIVKKGQIIARLDPSLLQTQIEQQRANVTRAEADLERLRVSLADSRQKLQRAKELTAKNLIPRTELETTEVNVRSAEAQIKSSEASLVQARSQLNTAEVNMAHTVIEAPIDGIVISRNVEPGQTVAASMSAPTLFVLAADLTKMQVNANIDEADVGRMRPGQMVTFRVDAFPADLFTGAVQQVRLQPTTVQNVVTYQTVIAVPNPQMKLKPGMTANVTIEVSRRSNVLRMPNGALRFRPTNEMFAALNQEVPPEMQRGQGTFGRGGQGGRGGGGSRGDQPGSEPAGAPANTAASAQPGTPERAAAAPQAAAPAFAREPRPGAPETRGGGDRSGGAPPTRENMGGGRGGFDPNMTPEERQRRLEERMASMTPEERERFQARMAERAQQGGSGGMGGGREGGQGGFGGSRQGGASRSDTSTQGGGRGGGRGGAPVGRVASTPSITSGATTIDSLFGPLPVVETRGRAWLYINKQLKMVSLRLGISDGTFSEIIEPGDLQPGTEVVTNVITGLEPITTPGQGGQSNNPLMGQPQRGMPGGPGGGRGR